LTDTLTAGDELPLTPRERTIKTMWNAGNAASVISRELGISRSAVTGKVDRMRKKGHKLIEHRKSPTGIAKPPPVGAKVFRSKHMVGGGQTGKPRQLQESKLVDSQADIRAPGQLDKPWGTRGECQWPTWGPDKRTGLVCGLPVDAAQPSRAWCPFHGGIAYVPFSRDR